MKYNFNNCDFGKILQRSNSKFEDFKFTYDVGCSTVVTGRAWPGGCGGPGPKIILLRSFCSFIAIDMIGSLDWNVINVSSFLKEYFQTVIRVLNFLLNKILDTKIWRFDFIF